MWVGVMARVGLGRAGYFPAEVKFKLPVLSCINIVIQKQMCQVWVSDWLKKAQKLNGKFRAESSWATNLSVSESVMRTEHSASNKDRTGVISFIPTPGGGQAS